MDEQLKKMLLDAAQKGINGVEQTIDWIGQQAPELLQQLVIYNMIESGLYILLSILGAVVVIKYVKKVWEIDEFMGVLFLIIGGVISLCGFFSNVSTFIKCISAPKLFIFEYLSSLLK